MSLKDEIIKKIEETGSASLSELYLTFPEHNIASIRGTVNKLVAKGKGELNRRKEEGTTRYYKESQLSKKERTSVIKKGVEEKTKETILIKPNKCSYYPICKGKNKGFRSVCETTGDLLCKEEATNDET